MKQAIVTTYTFTPASKTINFSGITNFNISKLYAVINITKNQLIYAVGQPKFGFTSIASTTVTFLYDTTAMAGTDVLSIIYDTDSSVVTLANPVFDSSTAALAANASYTTPSFDSANGSGTYLSYSAKSATALTVTFQESSDNVNWVNTDAYTVGAGGSNYSAHKMSGRYGRVVVLNGSVANAGGAANLYILVSQTVIASETDVSIVDSLGNPISSLSGGTGTYNLTVAQSATNFAFSTQNSSVAQLAASATFTGTIETTLAQQSISILLTSDQAGTLTINQYIDLAGTRKVAPIVFTIAANAGFARSFGINGNYVNVTFQNTGASTTTTFNLNTAYGTIPSTTSLGNSSVSLDEVNGVKLSLGANTSVLSLPVVQSANPTYRAAVHAVVTATTATDIFTIIGSATKTIAITKVGISGTATAAAIVPISLIKRSTANSVNGNTAVTPLPNDSNDAAATATVKFQTANPTTLGTVVGTVATQKLEVVVPTGAGTSVTQNTINEFIFGQTNSTKPIILRGVAQSLNINLNSSTITGNSFAIYIEWTEV